MVFKISIFLFFLFLHTFSFNFTNNLINKTQFDTLCSAPLNKKYSSFQGIKIVYEIHTDNIYFINSTHYEYHYDFCYNDLHNRIDITLFNKINYTNKRDRQYLLGNLYYFRNLNEYLFEISASDSMTTDQLNMLHDRILNTSYIKEIKLLLNSTTLINQATKENFNFATRSSSDIFSNLSYQCISSHQTIGRLHFITNLKSQLDSIMPYDIIVLQETPTILPKVSGVIINTFQTPLSHVSILGKNRKIPICASKYVFVNKTLLDLNKQIVFLNVTNDSFNIYIKDTTILTPSCNTSKKLKYDLSFNTISPISHNSYISSDFAGNKAYNFSILSAISEFSSFKVPEAAFIIPFYYYNEHLKKSGADKRIDILLKSKYKTMKPEVLKNELLNIQTLIIDCPINKLLLDSVYNNMNKEKKYTNFKFRSSTNAEDFKVFSGAGLYASKKGARNNKKHPVDLAIKSVWASLWNYSAFLERDIYNIDHKTVYMGILAHRSFPSEKINGVAITKNPYRPDGFYGFLVNSQINDISVVTPPPNVINEQFICYPLDDNTDKSQTVNIITFSNLHNDSLTMSINEIGNLATSLEDIKSFYYYTFSNFETDYFQYALDIEFKLDGDDRVLYIKQARPYND